MKTKLLSVLTAILFTMSFLPQSAMAEGGTGTVQDPYIISSASELVNIHNNLSAHYKLNSDIDMNGITLAPIGNETEGAFTGSLDGNGYSIKNLTIDSAYKSVGLFGYLEGSLTNIKLENAFIKGVRYTGGIVGYAEEGAVISGCTVSGTVDGGYSEVFYAPTGGIVGNNESALIENCVNNASVSSAGECAGGIAGYNSGTIKNCTNSEYITAARQDAGGITGYNSGNVLGCDNSGYIFTSEWHSGGIIGYSWGGTVSGCTNSGDVTVSPGYRAGGIIGGGGCSTISGCNNKGTIIGSMGGGIIGYISFSDTTIQNCANHGSIGNKNIQYQGGIAGITYRVRAYIYGCSNYGAVCGSEYVGGIAGVIDGLIKNSVNTAPVSASHEYCGGIVGHGWIANIHNCLNTGTVTGSDYSKKSICGIAYGTAYNCVNKGVVSNISSGGIYDIGSSVYNLYCRQSNVSLAIGERASIDLELYGYDRELTWTSGDESVAVVDSDGNVTGVGAGMTLVTVATELGVTASATVTVSNIDSAAEIVSLNKTTASLAAGETVQLSANISPSGASANVVWSSANTSVATVDSTGLVTAVKTGMTLVTARIGSGPSFACAVNVISDSGRVDVQSVSIPESSIMLAPGDAAALNAAVLPENATDKSLVYISDNEAAVSVNAQGIVTAKSVGTATIRAQSSNGCYDECVILVADASGPSVLLSEVKALPGGTADMKVNIVSNPGIAAYKLTVNYDDALLTPEEIIPNKDFGGSFTSNLEDENRDELSVLWYNDNDVDINGELFTVRFRVNESASAGDWGAVSVSYSGKDICSAAGSSIALYTTSAKVIIAEALPGDVYEDGDITVYDLTLLSRYVTGLERLTERQLTAGDVNDDGETDIKDVVKLAQYIVGWSGVELMAAAEQGSADIKIGSAEVDEQGEAFIPVMIENSSGLAGFRFNIIYDRDAVEILEVIPNTELLPENVQTNLGAENENGLIVTWYNESDMMSDGLLFMLKVRYIGDSSSEISINAADNNMCNQRLENVIGSYEAGVVRAKSEASDEGWDYTVNDISAENGEIRISITQHNAVSGNLIAAAYDSNGVLLGTVFENIDENTEAVTAQMNTDGADFVSVFIFSDIGQMKPISKKFSKKL